ncbi:MAG: peptidoglycan DD-metalloendopeptidase family protein [Proteobacteria bacterium]|nr:peptidoglycan DD-metalloendopeptidase family protein [Pseudomonadota bacterium]
MRLLIFVWAVSFLPQTVQAMEVVRGVFRQGGFMVGHTQPTDKVAFNGAPVPVGRSGLFVIGFERHEKAEADVKITHVDGTSESQSWIIEPRTYEVQHVTGVAPKHVNPDPKEMKWIAADTRKIDAARDVFADLPYVKSTFAWPVSATISGVYGSARTFNGEERSWHKGLDIAAPKGAVVHAPADGVVRLALPNSFFNGNMVILDHGHQFYTYYAHLDSIAVKNGQLVRTGDVMGKVGATGRATGPHLHWGVYWRKIALDPMLLMTEGGKTE